MAKGGNVKLKLNIWCLYISTKILINYFKHLYIPSLNKIKVKDLLTSFFFLICNFTFFFFFLLAEHSQIVSDWWEEEEEVSWVL